MEEERRSAREEMTEMDRNPQSAAEEIRNRAVDGVGTRDESKIKPPSINSYSCSARKRRVTQSDDEDRRIFEEHIRRMSEYASKRIKIDEERMISQREAENNVQERLNREKNLMNVVLI